MSTIPEALALALQYHQAGDIDQAEQIYRRILEADPNHADSLHLLGEIAYRRGRLHEAVTQISRAVQLNPYAPAFYCNLGVVYQALGRPADAVTCYEYALQLQPDFAEAYNNLGVTLKEMGRLEEAAARYREAVRLQPNYTAAYNNLGGALADLGRLDEAIAVYRQALGIQPDYAEAHNNLGNALSAQRRLDESLESFRQALRFKPNDVSAYINMGAALGAHGRMDEAIAAYQSAIAIQPDHPIALNNLAASLHDRGMIAEAIALCEQAVKAHPNYAEAHVNLGTFLQGQRRFDEAIPHFHEALRLKPHSADAYAGLGDALSNQGSIDEARVNYERALSLKPNTRLRILVETMLPLVYESMDHLRAERRRLTEAVARLNAEGVRLDVTQTTAPTPFFFAYQGLDDRDLRVSLARLYAAPPEPLPHRPGANGKLKVGFISAHFKEHTIGRLMQGLIANLPRDTFHVTVLSATAPEDKVTESIRAGCDTFIHVPGNLVAARRTVAEQGLDLLLYTDIGMDAMTSTLAFARLAPVQCVTWGHPETTGLETMDYYVSSALFETPEADRHYSETLVRLKTIPAYCRRPELPSPLKDRDYYSLPEGTHLYSCLQSMFKFHPEFDEVLAGILRRDPKGILVLSQGFYPHWKELLLKRFRVSMPDVLDQVKFLGWMRYADFLNLNAIADVLLDPMHFGGGRTSYEALGLGQPIVTLPSGFQKGRMTLAMYQKMEVMDCVAADPAQYIDHAVKLGTEPDYRSQIRDKILAANDVLYEDKEAARELGDFFQDAIAKKSAGSTASGS